MADMQSPSGKGGDVRKKSGGGFGDFVQKLLGGVSFRVDLGTGAPPPRPQGRGGVDGQSRMQPVLDEKKEAFDEIDYRTSDGERGQAPAERVGRERQFVARSLESRMDASAKRAPIPDGGGEPLSKDVRGKMEPKLGADLSGVRVHTGGGSAEAAQGMNARAFTVGSDVHFNAGQFAPGSKDGDKLLAHELTHVVQGQKSGIQRKAEGAAAEGEHAAPEVSHPDEPAEKEADAVSEGVAEDLHAATEHGKAAAGGGAGKTVDSAQSGSAGGKRADRSAAISAKLEGTGRKVYASLIDRLRQPTGGAGASAHAPGVGKGVGGKGGAASPAATAAPAAATGPDMAPIVGKLNQAIEMFKLWQQRDSAPIAGRVLTALNSAKANALELQGLQGKNTDTAKVDPVKHSLASQLQTIQTLDPNYTLFSIGDMAITVMKVQKKMTAVPVQFTCGRRLAPHLGEYKQQLQNQQDGINAMTCTSWLKNRDAFLARQAATGNGRSPVGTEMQKEYNRRSGSGRATNTAAPHNSDQVGGGHADPTGLPANTDVNSSIGGQWPDKIGTIDAKARAVPEIEQLVTQMNAQLTVQPA